MARVDLDEKISPISMVTDSARGWVASPNSYLANVLPFSGGRQRERSDRGRTDRCNGLLDRVEVELTSLAGKGRSRSSCRLALVLPLVSLSVSSPSRSRSRFLRARPRAGTEGRRVRSPSLVLLLRPEKKRGTRRPVGSEALAQRTNRKRDSRSRSSISGSFSPAFREEWEMSPLRPLR